MIMSAYFKRKSLEKAAPCAVRRLCAEWLFYCRRMDMKTIKIGFLCLKVWEQTYDGNCCDRMALSPDGKTLWVPSFGGPHWYVADAATGKLIKDVQTPATG